MLSSEPKLPSKDNLVDAGVIAAAVLAILLVALSTLGRYRCRHPAVRFFVWGISMVFLPLTSFVISNLLRRIEDFKCEPEDLDCHKPEIQDMWTLLLWLVLILTIKGNADVAAAAVAVSAASPTSGDVSIDGQRIRPAVELIAQYGFVAYLIVVCFPLADWVDTWKKAIFVAFVILGGLARVALKMAAFWRASKSFALGMNARLVAGYMEQLVADDDKERQPLMPRYIVMGERKRHVQEKPQGYRVKRDALDNHFSDLITLDRVWQLAEHSGGGIFADRPELRDLCLSFSLFKILRRRLSGYPLADAGSSEALEFVLRGMDTVGAPNADRVFRVLVNELWFASDFYYSPVPLCNFGGWCATLNYLCSVLIIAAGIAVGLIYKEDNLIQPSEPTPNKADNSFLSPYQVISFVLLAAVLLLEAWEIVAALFSNWTKMSLLGHYIRNRAAWRRFSCVHTALVAVLRLRPARRWRDKLGQNSVLEPRRFRRRAGFLSEKLYGNSGLMKSIDVSPAVKDAVLRSLQSSYGRLSTSTGRVGGKIDWAWNGDDATITERILAWHIGTRLFEMKSTSASSEMIAASHLSYYCAYLVAAAPELLPDCAAWTKIRYDEVSEDVRAALGKDDAGGSESTAGRYQRLVVALSTESRDKVLRRGAEIGRRLVKEYAEDEASACRVLADFWSDMLLYVAPSENVKGHVEAMARGGEFITLVWALLLHAGVTIRSEPPGAAIV